MIYCMIVSTLGFALGLIGAVFGLMAWLEWKSQAKSTHRVEFVPAPSEQIDAKQVGGVYPDFTDNFMTNRG